MLPKDIFDVHVFCPFKHTQIIWLFNEIYTWEVYSFWIIHPVHFLIQDTVGAKDIRHVFGHSWCIKTEGRRLHGLLRLGATQTQKVMWPVKGGRTGHGCLQHASSSHAIWAFPLALWLKRFWVIWLGIHLRENIYLKILV